MNGERRWWPRPHDRRNVILVDSTPAKRRYIAGFGCAGHIRPALCPRGCYCKHKMAEASVFYAKQSGFLRFRIAVLVPTHLRCPPAVHIGRCTPWAGSHFRQSYCRLQLRSCACSIVPAHRPTPDGEGTHNQTVGRSDCCHGLNFEGGNAFFQKHIEAVLQGPVWLYLKYRAGGPKSK